MESTSADHWRKFLLALAIVAFAAACIDLALREWLQAASSGSVFIGVMAFERSLRFHSVRWRVFAGIALFLAIAVHIARFAIA